MLAFKSVSEAPYQGYEKRVFEAERSGNGEYRVEASQQSPEQDQFADVRFHGETCQMETQRSQILCMVQGILTHHITKSRRKSFMSSWAQDDAFLMKSVKSSGSSFFYIKWDLFVNKHLEK